jgi:signal transduction histidine kinase
MARGDEPLVGYDGLPDGLLMADHTARVVVFNRAAARMTGVDAGSALGKTLEDALPLVGLDGRPWWGCALPYGGLRTTTGHPERNLVLPDGTELLVTSRYLRDEPGGPTSAVVVSLRDTRHRAREELSRAELVSTVAHELRSPLTSVKGFTATLLAKWDRFTDEQKRLMLQTVEADADRVTRLITELLDIARIDSGRLVVRRQVVDIRAVVQRHVSRHVASGADTARFQVDVATDLPEMWVDADKLDQILGNLLENAVRHGDGRVWVSVTSSGDGATVTVSDEGEGIPDELQRQVFTRFWRSGRRGGTGLGLYIVRGLVEAHGGQIEVGHAPSGGALFRFSLPAGTPDFLE